MKRLFLSLMMMPFLLNALSYYDTVMAFEEALENQSLAVYRLKCQKEEKRQRDIRESYAKYACDLEQQEIDRLVKESNERLDRY